MERSFRKVVTVAAGLQLILDGETMRRFSEATPIPPNQAVHRPNAIAIQKPYVMAAIEIVHASVFAAAALTGRYLTRDDFSTHGLPSLHLDDNFVPAPGPSMHAEKIRSAYVRCAKQLGSALRPGKLLTTGAILHMTRTKDGGGRKKASLTRPDAEVVLYKFISAGFSQSYSGGTIAAGPPERNPDSVFATIRNDCSLSDVQFARMVAWGNGPASP